MAMAQAQQMRLAQPACSHVQGRQQHAVAAAPARAAARPLQQAALAARLAAAAAQRRGGSSGSARRGAAAVAAAAPAAVESLTIQPVRVIEGHVKLPGSKSLSNRILLLAALAEGTTTVENILVSLAGAHAARRARCRRPRRATLPACRAGQ